MCTPTKDTTCAHVVHPVRTACAAGARIVVLTNAAGGLRPDMAVGQPVLISDHLNLTARSPLVGAQFVDLTDAYAPRLRELARDSDPKLAEGVYAGLPGPHYETPAEIRMLRVLGADLVGMSTVHETIAARAAGAEVLGVSLVTNLAAGITGEPLSHAEVLAAGAASATRMGSLAGRRHRPVVDDDDARRVDRARSRPADGRRARRVWSRRTRGALRPPADVRHRGLARSGARRPGRDERRGGVARHLGGGAGARGSQPAGRG